MQVFCLRSLNKTVQDSVIFGVDTANGRLSMFIVNKGEYYDYVSEISNNQAEEISQCVDNLFKKAEISFDNITHIVINIGSGSFTGIRIAVSYIIGAFSFSNNIKIIECSTLEIMRSQIDVKNADIAVIMKADNVDSFFVKTNNSDIKIQKLDDLENSDEYLYIIDDQVQQKLPFKNQQIVNRVSPKGLFSACLLNFNDAKLLSQTIILPQYNKSFL